MTPLAKANELANGLVTIAATHQVHLDRPAVRELPTQSSMPKQGVELLFTGKASNEAWGRFTDLIEDDKLAGYSAVSPASYTRNANGEVDTSLGFSFKLRVEVER